MITKNQHSQDHLINEVSDSKILSYPFFNYSDSHYESPSILLDELEQIVIHLPFKVLSCYTTMSNNY